MREYTFDDYDEDEDDDYYNPYGCNDDLFPYDYEDDLGYYEDLAYECGEMTTWQRITEWWHYVWWTIRHKAAKFWNEYLSMEKCGDCGKPLRFGNHDNCVPF